MSRLKVFTWHVHGNYMYYLSHADCDFYLPIGKDDIGYSGKSGNFPWGDNVHEVPIEKLPEQEFDVVLFQHKDNYTKDQHEILTDAQRRLPKVFLEHDPPREHPTDTKHVVDDPSMLIVHVTHFNRLMWDNNRTPSTVIEHGVVVPDGVNYSGEIAKGIVVINNIKTRGRRLGLDVFEEARKKIPLDLVGMNAREVGGIGEIPNDKLPAFMSQYRFFYYPIRYTSLGLSLCEAMTVGLPVVGLATTEVVTAVDSGVTGYVDTEPERLIMKMELLLKDPRHAKELGENASKYAKQHFNIERFANDWEKTLQEFVAKS